MVEYKLVDDQTNILGDKIRMYRQMREMNQIQLAEASGINVGTIRKYELGLRKPKPEQLEKIAAALHLNVSVFLDINISTIGDVLSLLFAIDNACDMNLNCQEDENGNKSFNISFSNIQLQQYLEKMIIFSPVFYCRFVIDLVVFLDDEEYSNPNNIALYHHLLLTYF